MTRTKIKNHFYHQKQIIIYGKLVKSKYTEKFPKDAPIIKH